MLPFSDSILKLSSVPALSAERIRGRALPPDPRGPSERSLVKPRRSPSSGLLRSEVVGFPPSALSSVRYWPLTALCETHPPGILTEFVEWVIKFDKEACEILRLLLNNGLDRNRIPNLLQYVRSKDSYIHYESERKAMIDLLLQKGAIDESAGENESAAPAPIRPAAAAAAADAAAPKRTAAAAAAAAAPAPKRPKKIIAAPIQPAKQRGDYTVEEVQDLTLKQLVAQVCDSPVPSSPEYGWEEA
eukprot:COSAG03_NODE_869_length_5567_cov_622.477601_2_plen_245_part_00